MTDSFNQAGSSEFSSGAIGGNYSSALSDSGSSSFDPNAVNEEIQKILAETKGKRMGVYEVYYLMYLMQDYTGQVTGSDSQAESAMNKFMDNVQAAWNYLHEADSKDPPGEVDNPFYNPKDPNSPAKVSLTVAFEEELDHIRSEITAAQSDPNNPLHNFFSSATGKQMAETLIDNMNDIEKAVDNAPPGGDALWELWQQYNTPTSSGQGTPGPMANIMREMGQLNQQVTGQSQILSAKTKADASIYSAAQNAWNNWAKNISKFNQFLIQNQKTY